MRDSSQALIDRKIRDTVLALRMGRLRLDSARSVVELVRATRITVDAAIQSSPGVRSAMTTMQSASRQRAAVLTAALIAECHAGPFSLPRVRDLEAALRSCCGPFPREATLLREALKLERERDGQPGVPQSDCANAS